MPRARTALASETALIFSRDRRVRFSASAKPVKWVENRALHIVEDHAILIRSLFTSYLELGSVSALKLSADAAGLHVPERIDGAGRRCGGKPFSRGHLYKILSNPIYIGQLSHKGKTYDGQHPAIVEQANGYKVAAKRWSGGQIDWTHFEIRTPGRDMEISADP